MLCGTANDGILRIGGRPTARQAEFFAARGKYIAYGGARGGGKSWALRRKLCAICLRYPGVRCLLIRRSLGELRANHLRPMLAEYAGLVRYNDAERRLSFPGGSAIYLGYCSSERDVLQYQGQEYDIIAIDEATQLSEYQFSVFKACLRGTGDHPRRIYLTCNPGGIGHAWVKRLFIDREYRAGEHPEDYTFIPATVYDNDILLRSAPDYLQQLEGLPPRLRDAWLYGRWDVFEGQFFPEFDPARHVISRAAMPRAVFRFAAADYGLDMLALLIVGIAEDGRMLVEREHCEAGLTLSEAARRIAATVGEYSSADAPHLQSNGGVPVSYLTASPDLWNRRQDSGLSGFEIMQSIGGVPPMRAADNRRIPGWRVLREALTEGRLLISDDCRELVRSLPALLFDKTRTEDAAGEPHEITHAPEALRYAVMSRQPPPAERAEPPLANFRFNKRGALPTTDPLMWDE